MATYTLSIEDRVGRGVHCTQRAVMVNGIYLCLDTVYNPNAQPQPFNSDDSTFDTPFSITHPFRKLANRISQVHLTKYANVPRMHYDASVNEAQQTLFENILLQEFGKIIKNELPAATQRSNLGEMAK